MDEGKITELLINLSAQMSAMQSDVKAIQKDIKDLHEESDKKDSLVREFIEERTRYAAARQDGIKAQLSAEIEGIRAEQERQKLSEAEMFSRISKCESKESEVVVSRWQQIKDYVFKGLIVFIGSALAYYILQIVQKN